MLEKWIKKNIWRVGIVFVGLLFMGVGVWQIVKESRGHEVEIVNIGNKNEDIGNSQKKIVVDVAGEVQKPGIYTVEEGARIGEALVLAGGLSADADRSYVARYVNQAQKLQDGMKVYIPAKGESVSSNTKNSNIENGAMVMGASVVSVNTSSKNELESLWGIGEARAEQIIQARPYASLEELKTKANIPDNVLEKNQGKIGL